MNFFDNKFHIKVEYINARERFITKLQGITDPEQKKKLLVKNLLESLKKKAID